VNIVLAIGLVLSIGLFGSIALRRLGLPSITGYIIIGIVLGPSVLGVIPDAIVGQLNVLTSLTLAVVA